MAKPCILLADDDASLTAALKKRLAHHGFDVMTVGDSYNALAQAVSRTPDVIILDVNMPAGDGFTVHERMRKIGAVEQPRLLDIPVIYLTGDQSLRLDDLASRLGAFAMLHKPFEFDHLLNTVYEAISNNPSPSVA